MTDQELEGLFQEIVRYAEELYAREPSLKGLHVKLLPPASDEHIAAMAEVIPAPIPASYAQFLRLHDGCLDFWGRLTLLGTKGRPRKIVAEQVAKAVATQGPEVLLAAAASQISPEAIAAFERQQGAENRYVPAYVVFGAGEGGRCLFFDHRKKEATGEPEVVDYDLGGRVRARHASFEAFLRATRDELAKPAVIH